MWLRRVTVPCRCFGGGKHPPGPRHLARNLALLLVAVTGLLLPGGDPPMTELLIGLLLVVNIALTLAVVHRQNEQGKVLAQVVSDRGEPAALDVLPGDRVGEFEVTTMDGQAVSRTGLRGATLIAFMAPGCPSCEYSLPEFVSRAAAAPRGREQVIAVVLGTSLGAGPMREMLAPFARVITEEQERGPLAQAFGVAALPAFALLDGDTMVASYPLADRIPDAIPA